MKSKHLSFDFFGSYLWINISFICMNVVELTDKTYGQTNITLNVFDLTEMTAVTNIFRTM